jgi:hypothetical protein
MEGKQVAKKQGPIANGDEPLGKFYTMHSLEERCDKCLQIKCRTKQAIR